MTPAVFIFVLLLVSGLYVHIGSTFEESQPPHFSLIAAGAGTGLLILYYIKAYP